MGPRARAGGHPSPITGVHMYTTASGSMGPSAPAYPNLLGHPEPISVPVPAGPGAPGAVLPFQLEDASRRDMARAPLPSSRGLGAGPPSPPSIRSGLGHK